MSSSVPTLIHFVQLYLFLYCVFLLLPLLHALYTYCVLCYNFVTLRSFLTSLVFARPLGESLWTFMLGLLENAVYGGRVDNDYDMMVLRSFLRQFFNTKVIYGKVCLCFCQLWHLNCRCVLIVGIRLCSLVLCTNLEKLRSSDFWLRCHHPQECR